MYILLQTLSFLDKNLLSQNYISWNFLGLKYKDYCSNSSFFHVTETKHNMQFPASDAFEFTIYQICQMELMIRSSRTT